MANLILIWIFNFFQTLLFGYQTENIANNRYKAAFVFEGIIGVVGVIYIKAAVSLGLIPACIIMGTSSAVGIVVGMWLYKKFK